MATEASVFEQHRPVLIGIAYRMLGSMWDAEDVVQDGYLRWAGTDQSTVRNPRAFLITVVSRLALDRLKSARVTRESYVGPWLPEPVDTSELGPLDTAELRDSVAFATLHMLERLSPPERAVFVLREAFDFPYEQIGDVVGLSPAHCRQLLQRARRHLTEGRERAHPSGEEHTRLLLSFLEAARTGDLDELNGLLADDVVSYNDGGGRVRAALRPILGKARVIAFVLGLAKRYEVGEATLVTANGQPALHVHVDGGDQLLMLDARDGRIDALFSVSNPEKLRLLAL